MLTGRGWKRFLAPSWIIELVARALAILESDFDLSVRKF